MEDLVTIAQQFIFDGKVVDVQKFGKGNINHTFLVRLNNSGVDRFILQRVNTEIFTSPALVMRNVRIITDHILKHLDQSPLHASRRWETPRIRFTREADDHWIGEDGSFWRAMSFIDAESFDTIQDEHHGREVGYALGLFHSLLSDLSTVRLSDTIEGFHVTPRYLRHYDEVCAKYRTSDSPEVRHCQRFVDERRILAPVLENAQTDGKLLMRTIHGDPKVSNIMIDYASGQAVSIIDMDTVKPGLIHYDIGDCLRSGCNPQGEETGEFEKVCFDVDCCRAILEGYIQTAGSCLTRHDFDYLYESIRLIAFELGLRFFTDYLEGNVYFRVDGPEHNLARALVQFELTRSIEEQENSIRAIIREMR